MLLVGSALCVIKLFVKQSKLMQTKVNAQLNNHLSKLDLDTRYFLCIRRRKILIVTVALILWIIFAIHEFIKQWLLKQPVFAGALEVFQDTIWSRQQIHPVYAYFTVSVNQPSVVCNVKTVSLRRQRFLPNCCLIDCSLNVLTQTNQTENFESCLVNVVRILFI